SLTRAGPCIDVVHDHAEVAFSHLGDQYGLVKRMPHALRVGQFDPEHLRRRPRLIDPGCRVSIDTYPLRRPSPPALFERGLGLPHQQVSTVTQFSPGGVIENSPPLVRWWWPRPASRGR